MATVTFKVVDNVVSNALVAAVQTYTAIATITDTSLDTLVANTDALETFADDLTSVITQVTDQLNFADVTDVSVVSVITAASERKYRRCGTGGCDSSSRRRCD